MRSSVLSSGRCDGDGICWRVADTFMIARFDDAECTRDARHTELADSLHGGRLTATNVTRGWHRMVTRLSASDASFYHLEEHLDPDVRRHAVDPAQAAQRAELRDPARHRRTAAAADSALPPEGARSDVGPGPAGVGRRPRLRHHLPHPPVGAAVTGQRRAAARAHRPARARGRWTSPGRCGRCI